MIVDPVTRRWADALYELARDKGELERVRADVERIGHELAKPGVAERLFDARLAQVERRRGLSGLLGQLSPRGRSFVELLFDKRRELVLRGLAQAFHQRSLLEAGVAEGIVESPRPLAPAELAALSQALTRRLGVDVHLENRISSGLLAGVRVLVQNRMIDYSARGRLEDLRRRLLEAPLSAGA